MVLVKDGPDALPCLVGASLKMMSGARADTAFSLGWNFVAAVSSMIAVLMPIAVAIVHILGSPTAVVNSVPLVKCGRRWQTLPKETFQGWGLSAAILKGTSPCRSG